MSTEACRFLFRSRQPAVQLGAQVSETGSQVRGPGRIGLFTAAGLAFLLVVVPSNVGAKDRTNEASLSFPKGVTLPAAFRRGSPASPQDLKAMEGHFETVVSRVAPAVVSVRVDNGVGSGTVISAEGMVVCAAHVCQEPGHTVHFVFPDGRTARGITLGTNHEADAGLMKITDPGPWPHVSLGDFDSAKVGDWVLALGHPGGFDLERPVVARMGRILRIGEILQTDCTLLGGDSGGPLFDMRGRLIGVHSRISDATIANFHVPIEAFLLSWERLTKGDNWGDQRPPTIGVRGVDVPEGCRLESVEEGGPGAKAGLLVGDLILKVQDEPIVDRACLSHCIRQTKPGDQIIVSIRRAGIEFPVTVKVEARTRWRSPRWRPGP